MESLRRFLGNVFKVSIDLQVLGDQVRQTSRRLADGLATWVPRNWALLTSTPWQTYLVAIGLGLFGIAIAYGLARAIRLHPMNARTIGLETGIQNGPLAIAIVLLSFSGNPDIGLILIVPALYSLFIVIVSTFVTLWFRRANLAEEQKIPSLL